MYKIIKPLTMYKKVKTALKDNTKNTKELRQELRLWISLSGYDSYEDDDDYNFDNNTPKDFHPRLMLSLLRCNNNAAKNGYID